MSEPHRVGTLEISEDLSFQEREWKVQRLAWLVMLVVIILALLGLFSTGPLSSTHQQSEDGSLQIDYQRFVRHDGRTTFSASVDGEHATNGEIEVWITTDYLERVNLQSINPQPDEVRDDGDRRIMVFLTDDPSADLSVALSIRPQEMWRLSGEVGVVDGPSVSFSQFSYP